MQWVSTKLKGKLAEHEPVDRDIPLFLPEQLVDFLFNDAGVHIDEDDVQQYWAHARAQSIPWASASDDGQHYPLALYGDSAKFSAAGDKITGIFMSMPLFDPRSARFSRFLLCALESHCIVGMQTLGPLYQKIVYSMWKLYAEGLFIKAKGRKVKFCTVEIRGDWEWHSVAFDFIPTWRSDQFCWRCEADKKNDPNFLDFSENPAWKLTERSNTKFLANCLRSPPGGPSAVVQWATLIRTGW